MKRIAVLGVTGSIGTSTIEVVKAHPDLFRIVLASAHRDCKGLFRTGKSLSIPWLALTDHQQSLPEDIPPTSTLIAGRKALLDWLAGDEYDIVLNAVTGSAGLEYSIQTLRQGKTLALANKESLVMAGHLMQQLQKEHGGTILPVDSEHSAIFQALGNSDPGFVDRLVLTASGGSFRTLPLEKFHQITRHDALQHPTWDMGSRITIDSATMMNKGLEVIEAHWLFNMPYERIETVIHPQSVIHSMVRYVDGSIIAQLSQPSMKLPILYALGYPQRIPSDLVPTDLTSLPPLEFLPVEQKRYPLFRIAVEAGIRGGILPAVLNAANEGAVQLFLQERIHFTDIPRVVENELGKATQIENPDLDTILQVNHDTCERVLRRTRSSG